MATERTVSKDIDEVYKDLKTALLAKSCKVVTEEAPTEIMVKQGSLWGISPTNAKKTITANLTKVDSSTKIACTSTVSSDWKNITVVGCALSALLVAICVWITLDLNAFMATDKASFWSWLITVNGVADFQVGAAFVGLTKALAFFLTVIIVTEAWILIYVRAKIDRFAAGILDSIVN